MTKGNFMRYYRKLSGADAYIIFFIYKKMVYMAKIAHIQPRWVFQTRESSDKGGGEKFMMNIKKAEKLWLIDHGAEAVMTEAEFNTLPYEENNGWRCEYWLHEAYGLGEYTPDHKPFDECGDVKLDGIEYQVKFQKASMTTVKTLHNAQKRARGLA